MIINLNLEGKKIIIIGGGNEAEKRIKSILNEKCEISVISDSINEQISNWVKTKKIKLKKQKIENLKFISELKPDITQSLPSSIQILQRHSAKLPDLFFSQDQFFIETANFRAGFKVAENAKAKQKPEYAACDKSPDNPYR